MNHNYSYFIYICLGNIDELSGVVKYVVFATEVESTRPNKNILSNAVRNSCTQFSSRLSQIKKMKQTKSFLEMIIIIAPPILSLNTIILRRFVHIAKLQNFIY